MVTVFATRPLPLNVDPLHRVLPQPVIVHCNTMRIAVCFVKCPSIIGAAQLLSASVPLLSRERQTSRSRAWSLNEVRQYGTFAHYAPLSEQVLVCLKVWCSRPSTLSVQVRCDGTARRLRQCASAAQGCMALPAFTKVLSMSHNAGFGLAWKHVCSPKLAHAAKKEGIQGVRCTRASEQSMQLAAITHQPNKVFTCTSGDC